MRIIPQIYGLPCNLLARIISLFSPLKYNLMDATFLIIVFAVVFISSVKLESLKNIVDNLK